MVHLRKKLGLWNKVNIILHVETKNGPNAFAIVL